MTTSSPEWRSLPALRHTQPRGRRDRAGPRAARARAAAGRARRARAASDAARASPKFGFGTAVRIIEKPRTQSARGRGSRGGSPREVLERAQQFPGLGAYDVNRGAPRVRHAPPPFSFGLKLSSRPRSADAGTRGRRRGVGGDSEDVRRDASLGAQAPSARRSAPAFSFRARTPVCGRRPSVVWSSGVDVGSGVDGTCGCVLESVVSCRPRFVGDDPTYHHRSRRRGGWRCGSWPFRYVGDDLHCRWRRSRARTPRCRGPALPAAAGSHRRQSADDAGWRRGRSCAHATGPDEP